MLQGKSTFPKSSKRLALLLANGRECGSARQQYSVEQEKIPRGIKYSRLVKSRTHPETYYIYNIILSRDPLLSTLKYLTLYIFSLVNVTKTILRKAICKITENENHGNTYK